MFGAEEKLGNEDQRSRLTTSSGRTGAEMGRVASFIGALLRARGSDREMVSTLLGIAVVDALEGGVNAVENRFWRSHWIKKHLCTHMIGWK